MLAPARRRRQVGSRGCVGRRSWCAGCSRRQVCSGGAPLILLLRHWQRLLLLRLLLLLRRGTVGGVGQHKQPVQERAVGASHGHEAGEQPSGAAAILAHYCHLLGADDAATAAAADCGGVHSGAARRPLQRCCQRACTDWRGCRGALVRLRVRFRRRAALINGPVCWHGHAVPGPWWPRFQRIRHWRRRRRRRRRRRARPLQHLERAAPHELGRRQPRERRKRRARVHDRRARRARVEDRAAARRVRRQAVGGGRVVLQGEARVAKAGAGRRPRPRRRPPRRGDGGRCARRLAAG